MNISEWFQDNLLVLIFFVLLLIAGWLVAKLLKKPFVLKYGTPIAVDHSSLPAKTLFSEKHLLVGRPDYIIKSSDGSLIPVELKSTVLPKNKEPYESHKLQLTAYCLLIEDCCAIRPAFGIIQYGDGSQYKLPYTETEKNLLLKVIREMRTNFIKPNRNGRCFKCSFKTVCPHATSSA